jgi:predicted Zn finger-like uncharacterized protein
MGQITKCPSCGTMFKVVADQLKVSGGWVRCGHCAEVFDAPLNMQPEAPAQVPAPSLGQPDSLAPSRLDAAPGPADSASPDRLHQVEPAVMLELPAEVAARPVARIVHKPRSGAAAPDRREFEGLAFMRQARREAFWRLPLVRGGLGLLALLLVGMLGLQGVLDQRDRLAAIEPAAKPWLEALCGEFGCVVSPLRRLDALLIDGSSFHKLAPDLYRLAFAVKNGGALDVATPHVELTLTDVQNRTLARRVLRPTELGSPAASIKPGAEWNGGAVLRLTPGLGEVTGYRILAFYP